MVGMSCQGSWLAAQYDGIAMSRKNIHRAYRMSCLRRATQAPNVAMLYQLLLHPALARSYTALTSTYLP